MAYWQAPDSRHKVFLCYYHASDQPYRDTFDRSYSHLFISKSVEPGDIATDLNAEYIKRLIQEGFITDASVVVVLVGRKTYCRKHVDWEISAGLNKKVGGYSGLLGILLPQFQLTADGKFLYKDLPPRLADNAKSAYADVYTWKFITASEQTLKNAVDEAFQRRLTKTDLIDNSSIQMTRNTCS